VENDRCAHGLGLAIADLDDDTVALHVAAGHINDALAASTSWTVHWSADA
jgi:hypothetical protein